MYWEDAKHDIHRRKGICMRKTAPLFIAPECSAPGCHHNGDQYLMVKCRGCGHWFCEEHIEPTEPVETDGTTEGDGSLTERISNVPTVKRVDTGLQGLAYYLGYCRTCREQQAQRRPVDSSWLR